MYEIYISYCFKKNFESQNTSNRIFPKNPYSFYDSFKYANTHLIFNIVLNNIHDNFCSFK